MSDLSKGFAAGLLPVSAMVLCMGLAAQSASAQNIPVDRPMNVSGIRVACTGIGNGQENEARWSNYPLKLQTVGDYGQYLANEDVTVRDRSGAVVANVSCGAPWVLMRLQPGRYHATVSMGDGHSHDVAFTVPERGQRDVVVRFESFTNGRETATEGS